MLELEQARKGILATIPTLPAETVPTSAALGRIVAEPIHAPIDLPCFDNSAMDGYAVRSSDLARATAQSPVALKAFAESPAGEVLNEQLAPGKCVRLFTGSVLPPGADAVVMQEDTRPAPGQTREILFSESIKPWENVRFRGEDVRKGASLFSDGERVNVGGLGLLAAVGLDVLRAHRQPVIGLLSTGSELIEASQPIAPGKIFESNRVMLAALLSRVGARPNVFPLVCDDLAATQSALEKALGECDGVITTGGVSVGEYDYVRTAFERLGGV